MGIVIDINIGYEWEHTYFVQTLDETEAKQKAYKMAKQEFKMINNNFLNIPDTLEEVKNQDDIMIGIDIIGQVDHILI